MNSAARPILSGRHKKTPQERRVEIVQTVQDWLTGNCWLFGLTSQNWMLVAGGGLMAYVAALACMRWRRQRMLRHRTTRI